MFQQKFEFSLCSSLLSQIQNTKSLSGSVGIRTQAAWEL